MNTILSASAILGCVLYLVVAVQYALILRTSGFAFIPVLMFSAVWSISRQTHALDLLHVAFMATSFLIVFQQNQQLRRTSISWYLFWAIPALAVGAAVVSLSDVQPTAMLFYIYLICCIGTLLIIEQLIRNNGGLIKAVGLGMGVLLLYNLFIYAGGVAGGLVSTETIQARALGNTTIAIGLAFAPC